MSDRLHLLGQHLIVEYYGCNARVLDDIERLGDLLVEAARKAGATPIKREFHQFAPHGVSGVVVITESHLTIHTWPEHRYAAVDFFTCGEHTDPERARAFLGRALGATSTHHVTLQRGLRPPPPPALGNLWRVRREVDGSVQAARTAPDPGQAAALWLSDVQEDQVAGVKVDRVLHAGRTTYAQVEIVETSAFGKLLSLDGMAQSSASDEASYHEALVVPAFVMADQPIRRVMILGGGEGATLREVLRFPDVERCVMVDIDRELVDLCKRHLPEWSSGAFDDPRAEVRFEDARKVLARAAAEGERFDLIVGDLPEAEVEGPLAELYSKKGYDRIAACLAPGGVYAGQIGSLQMTPSVLGPRAILEAVSVVGPVQPYARFIPSFGGEWVFAIAGRQPRVLSAEEIDRRLAERRPAWPCKTYDGVTHQRLFALPKDFRAALER